MRPDPIDTEAREVSEQLERAAACDDGESALAAARRYVAAGLAIRVCSREFVPSARPAFGRPFPAKYPGRCAVCDQPVPQGSLAVYRAEDRSIAHQACGGSQ